MLKIFSSAALLLVSVESGAQYFQYSQYDFTRQRINPAAIGLSRYASFDVDSRHQRTGGDFGINSNFCSVERPLLNASTGAPWAGVGIALQDDRSGGIFRTQEVALTYALHVRINARETLSFGAKGLLRTSSISYDGLFTASQYVPDRGFDRSRANGENAEELRNTIKTFSAGLRWQRVDRKGRQLHHVGVSLFDLNQPQNSFLLANAPLPSSFVMDGGFQTYSTGNVHVFTEVLATWSGSTTSLIAGARIQKELNVQAKKPSDRLEVLAKYAVGRSGVIGTQWHRENISFGLSYDFPVFIKNQGNLGTVEAALELRRLVPTRAQRLTAKRKKEKEKQILAREKKRPQSARQGVVGKKMPVETDSTVTPAVAPSDQIARSTPAVEIDTLQTAIPTAQAGQLKQQPLAMEKITLHFAFEFNSTELDDETESFLQDLAKTLVDNEALKLSVVGHTDNVGSDKFNLRLSYKRAEAVKHFLVQAGVTGDRIVVDGKGMHAPLNSNSTEGERSQNRRVEISLYY